jgi:hypothetical protein
MKNVLKAMVIATLALGASVCASSAQEPQEKRVACVILRSGASWTILNNAAHAPIGCSSVVRYQISPGVYGLRLTYTFTADKVHALVIGSDEGWAGVYHAGASVGLDFSNIYIRNSSGVMVDPNSISGGNFFVMGSFE